MSVVLSKSRSFVAVQIRQVPKSYRWTACETRRNRRTLPGRATPGPLRTDKRNAAGGKVGLPPPRVVRDSRKPFDHAEKVVPTRHVRLHRSETQPRRHSTWRQIHAGPKALERCAGACVPEYPAQGHDATGTRREGNNYCIKRDLLFVTRFIRSRFGIPSLLSGRMAACQRPILLPYSH